MKTSLALLTLASVALLNAAGQSTDTSSSTNQPSQASLLNLAPDFSTQQLRDLAHFQTTTMTRVLGIHLEVDGVLPRLRRADHPLHLINPFAPAKYGTGLENVSVNPRTHQIEGISFITFRF